MTLRFIESGDVWTSTIGGCFKYNDEVIEFVRGQMPSDDSVE